MTLRTGAEIVPAMLPSRDAVYAKVLWRTIPFLLLCYLICRVDTAIVGYAKLQFVEQLHFNETIYGFGAGIFYLGYAMFEVPSNLYMDKYGVRRTLLRIMVLWGAVTVGMMFMRTAGQFVIARFLLGVAEGGFFPGILLYLTYWLPADMKARGFSFFIMANPIAGAIGGVLSGWVMQNAGGMFGLAGWQALFLWMGLPAIVLGIAAYFVLSDRPQQAQWLNEPEKQLIARETEDVSRAPVSKTRGLGQVLQDWRVYISAVTYFTIVSSLTMFTVWAPTIVRSLGSHSMAQIGAVTAIPYLAGMAGLIFIGRNSDRTLERYWHFTICALICAIGIVGLYFLHAEAAAGVACLCVAAFGLFGAFGVFFAIPSAFLAQSQRAAGLAVITIIGNLAGFVMPWISGAIQTATANIYLGMVIYGFVMMAGAVLPILFLREPAQRLRTGI